MFAKHPLDPRKQSLDKNDLADALRTAIIAELDAVSFYLQIARSANDEKVRRVFEDVAREEKTHVGEFLALLKELDPEQARELEKGMAEVQEITGNQISGSNTNNNSAREESVNSGYPGFESAVSTVFQKAAEKARILRKILPVTKVGPGVDYVVASVYGGNDTVSVAKENLISLHEVSVEFLLPPRLLERSKRIEGRLDESLIAHAARQLVLREETVLVNTLLQATDTLKARMGEWSRAGEAVEDVARTITMLERYGVTGPFILLLSPTRYTRLLMVSEQTGLTDLARLEKIVKVVRHPLLDDKVAIIVPSDSSIADIVVGVDTRVDYIGLEAEGHRFRVWETITLRVKCPNCIAILKQEG